jgi:cytochrome c peroxidase
MRSGFSVFLFMCVSVVVGQDLPVPANRLPPRAERTAEEYSKQAAELREQYAKPSAEWPKPTLDKSVEHREIGLLGEVEHPATNPFSKDKVELGKALFFDARLSGSGQIACASCHDPDLSWSDGRTTSFGHARKVLKRNAPTLLNVGFGKSFFWDGRADSLEAQAKAVLANPDEMQADEKQFAERLSRVKDYPPLFEKVYGDTSITLDRVTSAIACFERTLVGGRSRFDLFLKGKTHLLSDAEVRGLHLFRTDARCINCHNGSTFTDGQFHDVGLSYYGRLFEDVGRFRVTKKPEDVGKFKTPTLRNVGKSQPYMHNGLFEIDEVLRLYNVGMPTLRRTEGQKNDPNFPTKSALLKPLQLNKHDLADLEAFLRCLDEPPRKVRTPAISQP